MSLIVSHESALCYWLTKTGDECVPDYADVKTVAQVSASMREVREALLPNAASPMEVLLVLAFVLPPRLGGWGFPEIQVNQRINVDEHLRVISEADFFVGDIYLPSVNGDVEYDSEEFHTGRWRADHTQARRNVLEVMDVKTMSATWSQLSDFEKFRTFIWMVKERFGIPHRTFTPQEVTAQVSLYEHLTDFGRKLF